MAHDPPSCVVAAPHRLLVAAIAASIESDGRLTVASRCHTGPDALHDVRTLRPTLAVLGADLPGLDGVAVCRSVKVEDLPTRVLVLADRDEARWARAAFEGGADGFVPATAQLAEVLDAAAAVAAGEAYVPAPMLGTLLRSLIERRREEDQVLARWARLSRREREVLALLADGRSADTIAGDLYVSTHTVRSHITNSLSKLAVGSRTEAVALARDWGLIERFEG